MQENMLSPPNKPEKSSERHRPQRLIHARGRHQGPVNSRRPGSGCSAHITQASETFRLRVAVVNTGTVAITNLSNYCSRMSHGSAPTAMSVAEKNNRSPIATSERGWEDASPGRRSPTMRVPALVPSLTQSS